MPTSVMPKGVEHLLKRKAAAAGSTMPTSVMPKGVEHLKQHEKISSEIQECPPL